MGKRICEAPSKKDLKVDLRYEHYCLRLGPTLVLVPAETNLAPKETCRKGGRLGPFAPAVSKSLLAEIVAAYVRFTKVEVWEMDLEGTLTRAFPVTWQLGLGLNKRVDVELRDSLKVFISIL